MKTKELHKYRTKSVSDLQKEVAKLKVELWTELVNLKAGKSSSPNKKRTLKRDISQISTIIHERELQDALIIHERELQDATATKLEKDSQESKTNSRKLGKTKSVKKTETKKAKTK